MKRPPPLPDARDAPADCFGEGHLWIQEWVDGDVLRFSVDDDGLVRAGDAERTFERDAVPPEYRRAVRHVRDHLDRGALYGAVGDVSSVVFVGVSTHRRRVDYDWERTPPFLGVDVWAGDREQFLPPDAVERAFDRLGIHPVNAFDREVRAAHFDVESYAVPRSRWYDGPATGALFRNKAGGRAVLENPAVRDATSGTPLDGTELLERYATAERFERTAAELESANVGVSVDALRERVFEDVLRERHGLFGERDRDLSAFRAALAARARAFLDARDTDRTPDWPAVPDLE